ncbi:formamidopyrimidine-DNA glycosylase [Arthrobacter sp. StoSoilB3]|uniref:DNA-(apurinic or apyrimidinic site) lyase n=1 Tax=Paenarthrobacter nicotinovorans TaxID=29320 RepID=A0ABT9TIG3_PAENI|nr:endonuclease-8/formamidopyrimidine-DNA glycosylase [Paenarthrobacter nicotinovorans]BCW40868.1 formamidopyrimidine-DNA glycosylase [Arthrobacter sp. StoSoilB3]
MAGASLLTGHTLEEATAHGKQFFLRFDHGLFLHVHLGLYGAWSFGGDSTFTGSSSIGAPRRIGERESGSGADGGDYAGPPEPVGAVRVRLVSKHGWADLRGATTCAAITAAEAEAVLDRLGPDPLQNRPGDREEFIARLRRRKTAVALLLMDQSVLAGVGNIYRAEVLFRQAVDPWTPGTGIDVETAGRLWDDTVATMSDGVRDGRIVTTPPSLWTGGGVLAPDADAHFVYKREGMPCRACGTLVGVTEIGARKLYWCPGCQV